MPSSHLVQVKIAFEARLPRALLVAGGDHGAGQRDASADRAAPPATKKQGE